MRFSYLFRQLMVYFIGCVTLVILYYTVKAAVFEPRLPRMQHIHPGHIIL